MEIIDTLASPRNPRTPLSPRIVVIGKVQPWSFASFGWTLKFTLISFSLKWFPHILNILTAFRLEMANLNLTSSTRLFLFKQIFALCAKKIIYSSNRINTFFKRIPLDLNYICWPVLLREMHLSIRRCSVGPHATPEMCQIAGLTSAQSDNSGLNLSRTSWHTTRVMNVARRNMFVLWKYCSGLGFQFQILINCKLGMDRSGPTWGWGQLGSFWI